MAGGEPGIAAEFGLVEELLDGEGVALMERALDLLEILDEDAEGAGEERAIGEGDIAPHFWGTAGDAGGVAETGGAEGGLFGGVGGAEDVAGESGSDDVGEVTGAGDEFVVLGRAEAEDAGLEG